MPQDRRVPGSAEDWLARARGDGEPVEQPEYRRAVELAERVVRWAEELVVRRP